MSITSTAGAIPAATSSTRSTIARVAWIAGGVLIAAAAYYIVGIEQSAVTLLASGTDIHELMHDGRHLLGFPCH